MGVRDFLVMSSISFSRYLTIEESPDAVAFHKSSAAQGRLTKVEDIVPIVELLVKGQHWLNGQVRSLCSIIVIQISLYSTRIHRLFTLTVVTRASRQIRFVPRLHHFLFSFQPHLAFATASPSVYEVLL